MNIKELDLLEKQDAREKVINRTEVLDKVKGLLLLPNTEYATIEQVAKYYDVSYQSIETVVNRHKDELILDGFETFRKSNVIELLNIQNECLENVVGKSIVTLENKEKIEIPNRGLRLFPKRAILRVGMLLRDSQIAKEVRTQLLNIIHDTQEKAPEIIENITNEITQEQQIYLKIGEAINNGDVIALAEATTELNQLKNKRITELENTNKQITTNALTIMESKSIINRIVRSIAMKEYSSMFGKAYSELYSKVNYKLGINIKGRNKKKNESLLDTLSEEETLAVEKIVRSWAVEVGLDLDKLLKIA